MSKDKNETGKVVEFSKAGHRADTLREARREAKAKQLRNKFSAARRAGESKTKAAERLKNLFKQPKSRPGKKT